MTEICQHKWGTREKIDEDEQCIVYEATCKNGCGAIETFVEPKNGN
jgi:hypothetical protein